MGLRTAADAAGQLIFLPLLWMFAQRYGWCVSAWKIDPGGGVIGVQL
jgi:hypothetical protein